MNTSIVSRTCPARALLIAVLSALTATSAAAADTPAAGGPAGKEFRSECPDGQFLAGLEIRAGRVFDTLKALCAPLAANKTRLGSASPLDAVGGTSDGAPRRAVCPSDQAVSALRVARSNGRIVNAVQVTCSSLSKTASDRPRCISTTGVCLGTNVQCGPQELARGIHGRAGNTVDALGLVCGPRPGAEPPAAPVATAPAAPEAPPEEPIADIEPAAGAPAAESPPPAPAAPPSAATAPPPVRSMAKKAAKPIATAPGAAAASSDGADPDGKWRLVPVYFGTDRKQAENATRLSYGSDRARKLELGRALVSVPTAHLVPNVERPWALTIPGTNIKLYEEAEDPAKHFTMREIKTLSEAEFLALVKERLKSSKEYKDQALIFIHGYNSSFDNAVYRCAQIAHDLNFDGAPFLYSWPSRGELASYTYDRASNEQSEPFMRDFVELVTKKSGAKSVSVIAHSMGNQLTMRVLRELKNAKVAINQIILAAPDVDRDSFENIARDLKGFSKGITLYAAANDKALLASKTFHGGVPRAGDVPANGPVVVEGVDTIDVTTLSTDSLGLNHSTYAERTALIDDIARILKTGLRPPAKRMPQLVPMKSGKMEYWRFPAP